jgi:hypothetical protein
MPVQPHETAAFEPLRLFLLRHFRNTQWFLKYLKRLQAAEFRNKEIDFYPGRLAKFHPGQDEAVISYFLMRALITNSINPPALEVVNNNNPDDPLGGLIAYSRRADMNHRQFFKTFRDRVFWIVPQINDAIQDRIRVDREDYFND